MTMVVNQDLCRGCGECLEACPNNAVFLRDSKAFINQTKCTSCQICAEVCPTGALQLRSTVTPAIGEKPGAMDVLYPQTVNGSLPDRSGWGQAVFALAGQFVLPHLADTLATFLEGHLSPSVPEQTLSTKFHVDFRPYRQRRQRRQRRGRILKFF